MFRHFFAWHRFLVAGWTSESDNGVDTAAHPPSTVVDVPTAIQPEMLISLLAPAVCSRHFAGRYHLLGGRFLPADLIKKYDLDRLPLFPGLDVVVDLKNRSPPAAGLDGEPSFRNRKDAADDDFPPPPTSKETRGKAPNEDWDGGSWRSWGWIKGRCMGVIGVLSCCYRFALVTRRSVYEHCKGRGRSLGH